MLFDHPPLGKDDYDRFRAAYDGHWASQTPYGLKYVAYAAGNVLQHLEPIFEESFLGGEDVELLRELAFDTFQRTPAEGCALQRAAEELWMKVSGQTTAPSQPHPRPLASYSKMQAYKAADKLRFCAAHCGAHFHTCCGRLSDSHTQDPAELEEALRAIIWHRDQHAAPLLRVYEVAKQLPAQFATARLKPLPTLLATHLNAKRSKLQDLSDLGGVRLVFATASEARQAAMRFVEEHEADLRAQIAYDSARWDKDGYQAVHVRTVQEVDGARYKIEVQFRSAMQHAWASLIDLSNSFTGYWSAHWYERWIPLDSDNWTRYSLVFSRLGGLAAALEGYAPETTAAELAESRQRCASVVRELRGYLERVRGKRHTRIVGGDPSAGHFVLARQGSPELLLDGRDALAGLTQYELELVPRWARWIAHGCKRVEIGESASVQWFSRLDVVDDALPELTYNTAPMEAFLRWAGV